MTCPICKSYTNYFPLCPEMWANYPGWCQKCISEEIRYQIKIKRSEGFYMKLAGRSEKEVQAYVNKFSDL